MLHVGVDPGWVAGAVAILDDSGAYYGGADYQRRAGKRAAGQRWVWDVAITARVEPVERRQAASLVGVALDALGASELPYTLTAEGLFGRGRTLEYLAHARALLCGPLIERAVNDVEANEWRPRAVTWRPEVLGLGGSTSSDIASAAAIRWAEATIEGYPRGASEHLAEAACLAWWGRELWRAR